MMVRGTWWDGDARCVGLGALRVQEYGVGRSRAVDVVALLL